MFRMTKMLVMDVDGTLTDGKIYIGSDGELFKAFDIKDGYAIYDLLPDRGIIPVIITGRVSEIVNKRCAELGVTEIHQGCLNKVEKMKEIARKIGLNINSEGIIEECAYIGDDILDISGMKISGISGCPSDAVEDVKKIVDYVCVNRGGDGAVREFVEWIISNNK